MQVRLKGRRWKEKILEKEIGEAFVSKEAPVSFIKFLEQEANRFSLLIDISPKEMKTSIYDFWVPIGFSISVKGKATDCLSFIDRLEQGQQLVEISHLNIERIDESKMKLRQFKQSNVGDVNVSLTLKVFTNEDPIR